MSKRYASGIEISKGSRAGAAVAQGSQPGNAGMEPDMDGDMPPLVPIQGAVAGGGIGGDQAIGDRVIQAQIADIEVVSAREIAARERIAAANRGRDGQQALQAELLQLRGQQQSLLRDARCLLPSNPGLREAAELDQRRAIAPLVDMFFDAFRPFLTEAYDDDATFRECFGIAAAEPNVQLTPEQNLLRTGFELLLKESIVQGINRPQAAITALTQLLFNNNPATMLVSAGGSIVAIILARDVLLWFSNTVLSVMTFGMLSVEGLTNLLCFVYNNCSLANIRNLLIYLHVAPENAQQFIFAIRNYNREQRQYIIMTIFLFGLNAIRQGLPAAMNLGQINNLFAQAGQYMDGIGMNDEQLRAADAPIIAAAEAAAANPAGAAAAANPAAAEAAVPADAAGAAAALNNAGAPVAPNIPPFPNRLNIGDIFLAATVDIRDFIRRTFRSGWSRGLRLTRYCLRDVFTLYLVRQPAGQGLVCDLVNVSGRVARWGVAAIQERSAVLDPDKPSQEVFRLLARLNGIGMDDISSDARCEAALYNFAQNLKLGAKHVLEHEERDAQLVYLGQTAPPGCLRALRGRFLTNPQQNPQQVNVEHMQQACLGMRLFVFERGMKQNILLNFFDVQQRPDQPEFNDTQNAVAAASLSVERMSRFIHESDPVTNRLYCKARFFFQAFANLQGDALAQLGEALRAEEPVRPARDVLAEQSRRSRIHTKEHIKSAIRSHVLATEGIAEQKQNILDNLLPRVDAIDFTGIEQYLLGQNPAAGIPQTFIAACQEAIRDVPANATASMYSGLSRCAASFTNLVVEGSNFTVEAARTGINFTVEAARTGITRARTGITRARTGITRVSELFRGVFRPAGAGAGAAAVLEPDAQNIVNNIEAVIAAEPVIGPVDVEVPVPGGGAADVGDDVGDVGDAPDMRDLVRQPRAGPRGGRSRKRSASRGTRRKGKQASKKLKRKSRRYQRRASSRKGRK